MGKGIEVLIRDREGKYGTHFSVVAVGSGIVRLACRTHAPRQIVWRLRAHLMPMWSRRHSPATRTASQPCSVSMMPHRPIHGHNPRRATRPTLLGQQENFHHCGLMKARTTRLCSTIRVSMYISRSISLPMALRCMRRETCFIGPSPSTPDASNPITSFSTQHSSVKLGIQPSEERRRGFISAVSQPVHFPITKRPFLRASL